MLGRLHNSLGQNFRLLGLLPLMFFLAQALHYWRTNEPVQLAHMLWTCNVGNLLLAVGLLGNKPSLIRVATLWILPGFVIWFVFVVLPWGVFLSSVLAHLGGSVVALIALRKIGMDRRSWLYAFAGYLLIQLISRLVTPADLNVNVSHKVYEGFESTFNSYWKFWLVTTGLTALILWGQAKLLRMLWPALEPESGQDTRTVPT